jgi:hypothetical protein
MTDIPHAVWSGTFQLFGVDVHCHVLDNGQRVIDEDSMVALLEAMSNYNGEPGFDAPEFWRWYRGAPVGGETR